MIITSAPYDCSDDDSLVLSCMDGGPEWWQIGRQVAWSLIVWSIIVGTSLPTRWIWLNYCYSRPGVPPRWVQQHVGNEFHSAKHFYVENIMCLAQFFASSTLVWIWVQQSYAQKTIGESEYKLEFFCVSVCFCHALFDRIRNGFSLGHALSLSIFLDCLTLPPIITQGSNSTWAGGSWLTLAYLRTYHCWKPMKRLLETDYFDHIISDFVQECVLAILECILVIFSIAGTLWLFEAMGDIEGFSDQFTDSGMGGISFFQMVYFSFVTISTVGFGDYSPTTVLSRSFIVFATFGGVIFFSYMTVHVFHIFDVESSGRGKFVPMKKTTSGRGHILVMGGGVTCGSVTVLETFLRALCRYDSQDDIAEVVLMGQSRCSDKVRTMLRSEWAQGFHLTYFIGSPLDPNDLERVRAKDASVSFIIADFHSPDTKMEDAGNALFASALQRSVPNAEYRLMLVSMPSISLCSSIGLKECNFFAIEALKAAMMATSIRCPGFSTLLLNLGLPDLPPFDAAIPGEPVGEWLNEYVDGCRLEPYGFLPSKMLIGMTFTRAALRTSTLGGVLLFGAQGANGSIKINPKNMVITTKTVLFALAKDSSSCDVVAKNNDAGVHTWISQFQENKTVGNFWRKQHEKAVRRHSTQELDTVYGFDSRKIDSFRPSTDSSYTQAKQRKSVHQQERRQSAAQVQSQSNSVLQQATASTDQGGATDLQTPTPILSAFTSKMGMEDNSQSTSNTQSQNIRKKQAAQRVNQADQRYSVDQASGSWRKLSKAPHITGNVGDLKTLAEQGGHTVLVMQEDHDELDQQTLWEQLEMIVKGLAHARDERPIIVVHSYLATPSRQRFMAMRGRYQFGNVSFCVGDPLNPLVLQAAGVDTCARLLTIAPSAPPTEISPDGATLLIRSDEKMDESNLMLVMVLEQHMSAWGRTDFKAIFDWYAPSSLNLLPFPKLPPQPLRVKPRLDSIRRGSFQIPVNFSPTMTKKKASLTAVSPEEITEEEQTKFDPSPSRIVTPSEGDIAYSESNPRGHYRFAAGQVIPKPFIAALYSMAYYTPGVLEIMESLINPHQYDQESMPWIFKVPSEMVNCPYNSIARDLLISGTLPLGLLRSGGEDVGTPLPYVVTLTPSSTLILKDTDCVYVLAEHAWAVKHGLDCGPTSQMSKGWTKLAEKTRQSLSRNSSQSLLSATDKSVDLAARTVKCFSAGPSVGGGSRSRRQSKEHDDDEITALDLRNSKDDLDMKDIAENDIFGEFVFDEGIGEGNIKDMEDMTLTDYTTTNIANVVNKLEDQDDGHNDNEEYDDDNDNDGEYEYDEEDDDEYDSDSDSDGLDVVDRNRKPRSRRRPKNLAFRGTWNKKNSHSKPKLDFGLSGHNKQKKAANSGDSRRN
mmetsp:Transcript_1266/g.1618  ORF Transcript_1266/g.1618 Transcript_1266/m.1618 type:complete len:1377 (+) Transcript_1266:55-4185(+)